MEKIGLYKNKKLHRVLIATFGGIFFLAGIQSKDIFRIILGMLFLYFSTYKREIYLTKDGIDYIYGGLFKSHKEQYVFKGLDGITVCRQKNKCIIYFIKEPMTKRLIVEKDMEEEVISYIEKIPNTAIEYVS